MAPGGIIGVVPPPFGTVGGGANALSGFATGNEGENVAGVVGTNDGDVGIGVAGGIGSNLSSLSAFGYLGCRDPQFNQHAGVYGQSDQQGVMGLTTVPGGTGVYGGGRTSAGGNQIGVRGETVNNVGVKGHSFGDGKGVVGESDGSAALGFLAGRDPIFRGAVGVYGESVQNGVFGRTASTVPEDNAVYGQNDGAGHGVAGVSNTGIGVFGTSKSGLAAKFQGDVEVTGDIRLVNGDCAEDFDIAGTEKIEPGTVMVLDQALV